jgi:methylmalonyl-CoA mutase cobalamin-binding subunit
MHELGACLVAVTAASEGWQVTYLGVNLPAEEIAGAARQRQAKAVALSVIYPADDPSLVQELRKLRGYLPADVVMIVGGRAAVGYREVLDAIGAIRLDTLTSLRTTLEMLRTQAVAP